MKNDYRLLGTARNKNILVTSIMEIAHTHVLMADVWNVFGCLHLEEKSPSPILVNGRIGGL